MSGLSLVKGRGKVSLGQWIQEARADATDESGPCIAIGCIHVASGNVVREVAVRKFGPGVSADSEELGAFFDRKSETFCQDLPGAQTFNLLAFYSKTPEEKHTFAISETAAATALQPGLIQPFVKYGRLNDGENGSNSLLTEPPTEKGVTQQGQRMVNEMFNRVCAQSNYLNSVTMQLMQDLHTREKDARNEAKEATSLVFEMLSEQMKAKAAERMAELEFARASEERKIWIKFGPTLINAIAGKEVFPEGINDTDIVEALADEIDEDTMKLLYTRMQEKHGGNPDKIQKLMGPLMGRMNAVMAKRKREAEQAEAARKALAAHPDPAADAAGIALPAKGETS